MLIIGLALAGAVAGLLVPGVMQRAQSGGRWLARPDLRRPGAWALAGAISSLRGTFAAVLGPVAELPAFLYLTWIGAALAAIDARSHRLPDVLVLPSYPIAGVLLGAAAIIEADPDPPLRSLGGGLLLAAGYYLIAVVNPGGMGLGDVKLAGLLGLHVGWLGWSAVLLGTLVAFTAGALVAASLMVTGRADRSSRLPFGPFMLVGAAAGVVIAG